MTLLFAPFAAATPPPRQPSGAELLRAIERLQVVGRVLYVAAHPDDENTRLLAWLVEHQRVRAAYLSLTRGEGGQNLLGSEQSPLLGVIRTEELLAARRVDGAEQLFGRERDFGYSKTPEETLAIWGHDEALGDVVWAIRRFQPDVIVTRFSPEQRDTHGHHTASAMLAVEAFRAAADPKAYPEQLKSVQPWQAKRIVWNKGIFGPQQNVDLSGFSRVDVGGFDALLGESYGEIAARSRTMHKSQGFGSSPSRGPALEYFKLLAGEPFAKTPFDGIDFSWARVPGTEKLRAALDKAKAQFSVEKPYASVPALLEARAALAALPDNPWRDEARVRLEQTIAGASGLFVDAVASDATAVPGEPLKATLTALNRSPIPWRLERALLFGRSFHVPADVSMPETKVDEALAENVPFTVERTVTLPAELPPSNPHWLEDEPTAGRWAVREQLLAAEPEPPEPVGAIFLFRANGQTLTMARPVEYAKNDPVAGELRRPLEVLPPVTIDAHAPLLMFPDAAARELRVTVRATQKAQSGKLALRAPAGFTVEPAEKSFTLDGAGAEAELVFQVHPPAKLDGGEAASADGALELSAALDREGGGVTVDRSVVRLGYPHIPAQTLTPRARVKLVRFQMKRTRARLGYVPGAGDEVAAALRQVGYEVTILNDEALADKPLDKYQAIVIGVRAFNVNPRLAKLQKRLLDWAQKGGTLIVQYNTQNRISTLAAPIGPWPLSISQDRVTDENAAVERLDPKHAVFHAPNQIDDRDFANWVQERGLYFADKWDDHYQPLLSMHDANETAKKGSLLVAHYGKGAFVYTGISFFRQLPAGIPGAYRLFSNLLSYGR